MCPLLRNLETDIKDINYVLNIINDFRFDDKITGERLLYPMDIKSLNTVVLNNRECIEALSFFLDKRPVLGPTASTLTRLAELMLTLNAFSLLFQ